MSNNLAGTIRTIWMKNLQMINRQDFVGHRIADHKHSSWNGLGTIKFAQQAVITGGALNNYFDPITKTPIVQTNQSFTPNIIRYTAVEISLEDDIHTYIKPKGRFLVDTKEYFAEERDTAILGTYASANHVFDDADVKTATGDGAVGTPVKFTEANAYEILVRIRAKLTKAFVPKRDRWIMLSPDETAELLLSDRFSKSTDKAEGRLEKGLIRVAMGMDIMESNNLAEVAGTRHCLAGHGKPVSFGSVKAPAVFVSSIAENTEKFTGVIKATEKFGVTVFDQGAQNYMDVKINIA